jgi:hypothetical protein
MALNVLDGVSHWFGSDLTLSPTGDIARVNRTDRSKQRVFRRLMTNPGEYVFHPNYGAGVPAQVGGIIDLAKIKALIRGQMLLEASVSQNPEPDVSVQLIANGVAVSIRYTALPDKQPVALSFDVST